MNFLNDVHSFNGQAIDIKERNLIIYLNGCGFNCDQISAAISRDKRTVRKWLDRYFTTGEVSAQRGRKPKATTEEQTLLINLKAIEDPKIKLHDIKSSLDLNCSLQTISNRLRENGLKCRVARVKEHLSAGHKARRLQFANDHLNFNFWDRTIFVDESTFMTGSAYRQLIRRPIGMKF